MKKSLLFILLWVSISISQGQDYTLPYWNTTLSTDARIDDLLSRMTLEEKVSLLFHNSPAIPRLGIPAYNWWNEALHGIARTETPATVFPQAIALAATFDCKEVQYTFDLISDEARAKYHEGIRNPQFKGSCGLNFYTPNINIFRDPRWGRGMETYGEDPFLTGKIASAAIKGLQGDPNLNDSIHYFKTLACAKHVAVHSGPEHVRHQFNVNVSERDLFTTYLPAFKMVIDADVQGIMCAYNRLDGEPCCAHNKLLVDIIRKKWNYNHIIVSDCWAINDFWEHDTIIPRHETHNNAPEAMADAFNTEVDMECGSSYSALLEAVQKKMVSEATIDAHLKRVLRSRFLLGMFDPDSLVPYSNIPIEVVTSPKHRAQALKMAQKAIVLLKNNNQTLPLNQNIKTIAVVGSNANDSTMLWANYNGTPTYTVTLLQGIKNRFPNAKIIYEIGSDLVLPVGNREDSTAVVNYEETRLKTKDADVIIYVGGLSPEWEGEQLDKKADGFLSGDRTKIELPEVQSRMIESLAKNGKPLILVLCTGSAIALEKEEKMVDAIINAWYGGEEAGNALADVICGNYNPAGRLPITFYKSTNQLPDFENYNMTNRTYRYLHEKPLFPFGFGLSYSSFQYKVNNCQLTQSYSTALLSAIHPSLNPLVAIDLTVQNISTVDGEEVIQVYIRNLNDPHSPLKSLTYFTRQFIKAGSTYTTTIYLPLSTFTTYDEANSTFTMLTKPTKYEIMVGGSSDDQSLVKKTITIE